MTSTGRSPGRGRDRASPRHRGGASGEVLIVGGYGQVGRGVAERLAPSFPGRVVVAGRSRERAEAAAAAIGHGVVARTLDLLAPVRSDALERAALVLVCLDQHDTRFVEQCLARGVCYVDISADAGFHARVEALDETARRRGGTAVLSVGVAPGLTNLLAARARERMDRVDRIDVLVELGLGDHHGRAAVEWMIDNLDATFAVKEAGRPHAVRSFGESIPFRAPGDVIPRRAHRFNLSDQHAMARWQDVPSVSTWIRFDGRVATALVAALARVGIGPALRRGGLRRAAVWLLTHPHLGSHACTVAVRASGRASSGADELTLGVAGRREAVMTSVIAVETVRQVLSGSPRPGVHHSPDVVDLDGVIAALRAEMPDVEVHT